MKTETKNAGGVKYGLMRYEFYPEFKVEKTFASGMLALGINIGPADDKELKMFREREKEFLDTMDERFKSEFQNKSLAEALEGYGESGIIVLGGFSIVDPLSMPQRVASFVASAEVEKERIIPTINQIITNEDLLAKYIPPLNHEHIRVERIVDKVYPSKHPRSRKRSRFLITRSASPVLNSFYHVFIEEM